MLFTQFVQRVRKRQQEFFAAAITRNTESAKWTWESDKNTRISASFVENADFLRIAKIMASSIKFGEKNQQSI